MLFSAFSLLPFHSKYCHGEEFVVEHRVYMFRVEARIRGSARQERAPL